jgi:hypothetical protein
MTFAFDNCLSPKLAHILRLLDVNAIHLKKHLRGKTEDTEWLPEAGRRGWVVVTRDEHIRTRPAERLAWKRWRVTCVDLKGYPHWRSRWDQAFWVLKRWPDIEEAVRTAREGTWLVVPSRGRIDRLPP